MGDGEVVGVPLRAEHRVGEVVILIEHQVEVVAETFGGPGKHREFVGGVFFEKPLDEITTVTLAISLDELIETRPDVVLKPGCKGGPLSPVHLREIERQNLIPVRVARGIPPDREISEKRLEVFLLGDVVVAAEHVDEERLSKPARADEKEKMAAQFQGMDVCSLVDVVQMLLT